MSLAAGIALLLLAALGVLTLAQLLADGSGALARVLRPIASPTLRGGVARSLYALAAIPALALTLLAADRQARDSAAVDESLVAETAINVAGQVDAFVTRHSAGVRGAAEAIALDGHLEPDRLEQWLLRYHPIYRDFRTMLVAGPDGRILAGSAREGETVGVAPRTTRSVADRDYFRRPMTTGADFVSNGFRGRGFGTDPLIAISSPVVVDGRRWGVVEGSMDLDAFERLDASLEKLAGARLLLVDANGIVVHADRALGLELLDAVRETPLAPALGGAGATQIRLGDRDVLVGRARTALGWHVLVTKPVRTTWALLADAWWVFAAWLAFSALAAGALAWALARRVAGSVERLESSLQGYAFGRRSPFARLAGLPTEYQFVFRRLHGFVVRLAAGHRAVEGSLARAQRLEGELRDVLRQREREIADATWQLAEANVELEKRNRTLHLHEEHFRALAELATVGIVVVDASGCSSYVNAEWCRIAGLPAHAAAGRGWSAGLDEKDVARLLRPLEAANDEAAPARAESALLQVRRPGGETRWIQARATPIRTGLSVDTWLLATLEDVTELVASRQQIRNLAHRLETAKEEERFAIAQRLHEGIAQDLYGAKLALDQLRRMPAGAPDARDFEAEVESMLAGILAALRDVTNDLRPTGLDDSSLAELLRWHADRFSARSGLSVSVAERLDGGRPLPDVAPDVRLALFRAVQEALANIVEHAAASVVRIELHWQPDALVVDVIDDGAGTAPADQQKNDSFGLLGLRERFARLGGSVNLASVPGVGTVFSARVPLDAAPAARAAG
jgi:two-component system sensor histidine kinase UhpB